MTIEEAKSRIKSDIYQYADFSDNPNEDEFWQALDMLLVQEPCDDAISREELLKAIDTWDKFGYTETGCFVREPKGDYVPYIHYDDAIKSIKGMSSIKLQEKMGHWMKTISENGVTSAVRCSECGFEDNRYMLFRYCPNCGAKMESCNDN